MECFCGSVLVDNMVKLKGEDKTQRKGKRLTEPVDTPAVPRGVSSLPPYGHPFFVPFLLPSAV